jgi:hypothetical protein
VKRREYEHAARLRFDGDVIQLLNDLRYPRADVRPPEPPLTERLSQSMSRRDAWQDAGLKYLQRAWCALVEAGLLEPTHDLVSVESRRRLRRANRTRELARGPAWALSRGRPGTRAYTCLWLDAEGSVFERGRNRDSESRVCAVVVAIGTAVTLEADEEMPARDHSYAARPYKGLPLKACRFAHPGFVGARL